MMKSYVKSINLSLREILCIIRKTLIYFDRLDIEIML